METVGTDSWENVGAGKLLVTGVVGNSWMTVGAEILWGTAGLRNSWMIVGAEKVKVLETVGVWNWNP